MSSKEQINSNFPFKKNDMNLMEYINSVCSEMFSPWVAKLLMGVLILTQYHKDYDIIKHVNEIYIGYILILRSNLSPTNFKGMRMIFSVKIWQPQLSNRAIKS